MTFQLKVAESPKAIAFGMTTNDAITGTGRFTVNVTFAVTGPPSPLAVKRLLKKPPPKLRLKKPLRLLTPAWKLAWKPVLKLAPKPVPLLAPKLVQKLLRPLTLLLRPLRLKKRSKSQPLGAMTETKRGGLPSGRPPFSLPVTCGWTSHARLSKAARPVGE